VLFVIGMCCSIHN